MSLSRLLWAMAFGTDHSLVGNLRLDLAELGSRSAASMGCEVCWCCTRLGTLQSMDSSFDDKTIHERQ